MGRTKRHAKRAPVKARAPAKRPKAQTGPPKGDPELRDEPSGPSSHQLLYYNLPWVADRRVCAGVLCQLQYVRCGKKCWCMREESPWHGPYWFAYVANKRGKLACRYVGKKLTAARVRAVAE